MKYHYRKNPNTFWHSSIWQILSPVRSLYFRNYVTQTYGKQSSEKLRARGYCISPSGTKNTFKLKWLSQSNEENVTDSTACADNTYDKHTPDVSLKTPRPVNKNDTMVKKTISRIKRGKIAKLKREEAVVLGDVPRENDSTSPLENTFLQNTRLIPKLAEARKYVFGLAKPEIANVTKPKDVQFSLNVSPITQPKDPVEYEQFTSFSNDNG